MNPANREKRCRLSLECKESVKQTIEAHGAELGHWSLIGGIRAAVQRSKALFDLERRGTLFLQRHDDSEIEDVKLDT
jgi:hypothetical protein